MAYFCALFIYLGISTRNYDLLHYYAVWNNYDVLNVNILCTNFLSLYVHQQNNILS